MSLPVDCTLFGVTTSLSLSDGEPVLEREPKDSRKSMTVASSAPSIPSLIESDSQSHATTLQSDAARSAYVSLSSHTTTTKVDAPTVKESICQSSDGDGGSEFELERKRALAVVRLRTSTLTSKTQLTDALRKHLKDAEQKRRSVTRKWTCLKRTLFRRYAELARFRTLLNGCARVASGDEWRRIEEVMGRYIDEEKQRRIRRRDAASTRLTAFLWGSSSTAIDADLLDLDAVMSGVSGGTSFATCRGLHDYGLLTLCAHYYARLLDVLDKSIRIKRDEIELLNAKMFVMVNAIDQVCMFRVGVCTRCLFDL